jgi:short-subunit dehydrogenase
MLIRGRRIVITGASRGIGAELARALAGRGAELALVARSRSDLEKVAADVGGAHVYAADLSDVDELDDLVGAIEADGAIDALVNNAGVDLAGRLCDTPADRIAQLIAVNLTAPIVLSRAVIPAMLQRGSGHIVNISSLSGTNSLPGIAPYSASKAGLSHFTAGLRAELRGTPITTTLVQIGPVVSEMMDSLRAHGPTRRAVERLGRLQLSYDLPMHVVVDAIVDAIEHNRRHVRLPRRDALFPLLVEAPRRLTEWLLAGVDHQRD